MATCQKGRRRGMTESCECRNEVYTNHTYSAMLKTKITNLASMKAQKGTGKLISTIGILKSEQRKGSDYEVQIYIGADVRIG